MHRNILRRVLQLTVLVGMRLTVTLSNSSDLPPTLSFDIQQLNARIEKGKGQMDKLMLKAATQGTCWKDALRELEVKCKGMDPEMQSRLAFKFTACYNEIVGFPPVVCEASTPLHICMKHLDESNKNTFREFFLHTQDLCFFLEHQLWQEKTSEAVNEVTNVVVEVTKTMEESKETQANILNSQMESLKIQTNIVKENNVLHDMVLSAKEVFEEVQVSAMEQRQVFIEIFDKLSRMQKLVSWIQGEMSLLDMMGFYFAAMIFGFFCTASERTRHQRFWIVMLMIAALALERLLYNYCTRNMFTPESIQEWVWIFRRISAILGATIVVYGAAKYRDPQIAQKDLLTIVNKRIDKVMEYVEETNRSILALADRKHEYDDLTSDESDFDNDVDPDYELKKRIKDVSQQKELNDENRIPDMEDSMNKGPSANKVERNGIGSPFRENSIKSPSVISVRHGYNLRRPSEQKDNASFANYNSPAKKASKLNASTNYYSSDEDM